jgi:SAM-dependent methyltransferase
MISSKGNYYDHVRLELIEFIRKDSNIVLDVGCGSGNTGQAIKELGKAKKVIGIELVPEIANRAKDNLDEVICGDIETLDLPYKEYFDYIILGDVLEHLYHPWRYVSKIRSYLKKNGYIISSIPNVRYWQILKPLIVRGSWEYANKGILDITHLRFFTKKSMVKLFQDSGFNQVEAIPSFNIKPRSSKYNLKLINSLTFSLFEEFLAFQYILIIKR